MELFKTSGSVLANSGSVRPTGGRFSRRQLFNVVAAASMMMFGMNTSVYAETEGLEKEDLKFGFIKLTDMAPLAIAYEKGYFEDEGLYVTLEAQANWKVLLDRVIEPISAAAKNVKIGDCKIFVYDLSHVIRIRTGETGPEAL